MATHYVKAIPKVRKPRDPRELPVQISIRVPYWYQQQLIALCEDTHASLPTLVLDTLYRHIKPEPPKDLPQ